MNQENNPVMMQIPRLEAAKAVDIDILHKYKYKRALYDLANKGHAIEAVLSELGEEFVYLTSVKKHDYDLMNIIELGKSNLQEPINLPNQTIARSQIESIVLLKDIKN